MKSGKGIYRNHFENQMTSERLRQDVRNYEAVSPFSKEECNNEEDGSADGREG